MKFEYVTRNNSYKNFGYIDFDDAFERFVNKYDVIGVRLSEPTTISASYFLRLLQEGSLAKARGYGKGNNQENDESSNEMNCYYTSLLDHAALWKLKSGQVICTAMPYGDKQTIIDRFNQMVKQFSYPSTIKLHFLDDTYRFRSNGDYMIMISNNEVKLDAPIIEDIDLRTKAIKHSNSAQLRTQTTTSYVRDRYVSDYAKQRAQGICQLCGMTAPFKDQDGKQYLESHHIIWLSNGGEDSIDNTVALCPNCHRKMHVLNLESDVKKLLQALSKQKKRNSPNNI